MEKKMTKRNYFEMLKGIEGVASNADLVAFIDREIELLSKKRNGETKAQKENKELAETIYNELAKMENGVTVTDFIKAAGLELSNQKVTALFRILGDRVVKTVDGRKTLYSVAK